MSATPKVTILLADEDALRRDGLAAVLSGTSDFEVVASVADGDAALSKARAQRPDIAVIDLNLPKIHGIELVRRFRSEALGTRVVIMAGTADDEIVREVVRAGGDGYLLKNGPARHLVDAILYVRDGGQYFSPQLHRDGRDRHLLEEPPRPVAYSDAAAHAPDEDGPEPEEDRPADGARRTPRQTRRPRRPATAAPLRERIRENAASPELDDRDYEIMTMMAEGIRPIIDRLDQIDSRVAQMESGDLAIPDDPRGWLTSQFASSMGPTRGGGDLTRTVNDLEIRLPQMIEEAVTSRFNQMAGKLQQEIEETHVRTLETFVKNIQVKLVQRVSALEQNLSKQAEAMDQLREYYQRTSDNLSRLIVGVDRLAQELPIRLANARGQEQPAEGQAAPEAPQQPSRTRRAAKGRQPARIVWIAVACLAIVGLLGLAAYKFGPWNSRPVQSSLTAATETPVPAKVVQPAAGADVKTKLQAAQEAMDRKDYSMAEAIFREVVKTEPGNADALKSLASVLFREEKVDEAASILDKLPKD